MTKPMVQEEKNESEAVEEERKDAASELEEPRWSVVSFEKCVAKNLTYVEAAEKLKQLKAKKVSGLCIITDEAAERIS